MKKSYITPNMKIVKVQTTTQMLADSVQGFDGGLNTEGGNGSGALSRRGGSLWDDEEDFE